MDVNSSGCYVCADQQPHLFPLKTQEGRQTPTEAACKEAGNNSLLYLETLQVVFPFIRFTITVETDAGKLAFTVRP